MHYALVQWYWAEGFVHDSDYKDKVETAMRRTIDQACRQYEVEEDTHLCCQFEGFQIQGLDLEQVQAAGKMLAKTLGRFKHVLFVG